MSGLYAGDIAPQAAWQMLLEDPDAQLVDVRSEAEWEFVGVPDLHDTGRRLHRVSWQRYPEMVFNPCFAEELAARGIGADQTLFFICRSGTRSRNAAIAATGLGFRRCYNVAEGFEGERDSQGRRGALGGWKAAKLPWAQM